MNIVIIDCGIGNRASISNMLRRLGISAKLSNDKNDILHAQAIILPGIGAFDAFMTALQEYNLLDVLNTVVLQKNTPILGICLGMQVLFARSAEGNLPGLNWIDGVVKELKHDFHDNFKVPHIGWKKVISSQSNFITLNSYFYFVHSYHCVPIDNTHTCGTIELEGKQVVVAVRKNNIFGVQFHPEKSHKFGLDFFKEFIAYVYAKNNSSSTITQS